MDIKQCVLGKIHAKVTKVFLPAVIEDIRKS